MAIFSFLYSRIRERSLSGMLEGILLACLFFPILFSFYPVGFRFSMVNFTYGARGLDPDYRLSVFYLFARMIFMVYGLEILLRGFLLRTLLVKFSWGKAFYIHLIIVMTLLTPVLWREGMDMQEMGWMRFLIFHFLLQCLWALFFLRTGSLMVTATFHAVYRFVQSIVINDVSGPYETLYFYSSASDDFYWLILSVTFLAVSFHVWLNQRWGMRETDAILDNSPKRFA